MENKFILASEDNDNVWESQSMSWVVKGKEPSIIENTLSDIDIGATLCIDYSTISPSIEAHLFIGPVKLILGDTKSQYFRIIRFRTENWNTYRLLERVG